ncbi:hypothetical protein AAVH_22441 [Aphelenchoides avenae]|nr:hypothetical protein AAVH_22441 [Aphelenchus avenae]
MPDYQDPLQRSCIEFAFNSPDCKRFKVISQWTAWSAVDVNVVVNRFETSDDLEGMVGSIKLSVHESEENFAHPTCCYIPEKRCVVVEEKHPLVTFDIYYFYNSKLKEFLTVAVNKAKILVTRGKLMY